MYAPTDSSHNRHCLSMSYSCSLYRLLKSTVASSILTLGMFVSKQFCLLHFTRVFRKHYTSGGPLYVLPMPVELNLYTHRNGHASGRTARPGDKLNPRVLHSVLGFFAYIKNFLGRTEMRTRERKELQSIRTI